MLACYAHFTGTVPQKPEGKNHQGRINDVNDAATKVAESIDALLEVTNRYLDDVDPARDDVGDSQKEFYRRILFGILGDDAKILRKGAFNFNLPYHERAEAYADVVNKEDEDKEE